MKALLVLNDAPYGNERAYNGLRLAGSLSRQEGARVNVAWTLEADKVLTF